MGMFILAICIILVVYLGITNTTLKRNPAEDFKNIQDKYFDNSK